MANGHGENLLVAASTPCSEQIRLSMALAKEIPPYFNFETASRVVDALLVDLGFSDEERSRPREWRSKIKDQVLQVGEAGLLVDGNRATEVMTRLMPKTTERRLFCNLGDEDRNVLVEIAATEGTGISVRAIQTLFKVGSSGVHTMQIDAECLVSGEPVRTYVCHKGKNDYWIIETEKVMLAESDTPVTRSCVTGQESSIPADVIGFHATAAGDNSLYKAACEDMGLRAQYAVFLAEMRDT